MSSNNLFNNPNKLFTIQNNFIINYIINILSIIDSYNDFINYRIKNINKSSNDLKVNHTPLNKNTLIVPDRYASFNEKICFQLLIYSNYILRINENIKDTINKNTNKIESEKYLNILKKFDNIIVFGDMKLIDFLKNTSYNTMRKVNSTNFRTNFYNKFIQIIKEELINDSDNSSLFEQNLTNINNQINKNFNIIYNNIINREELNKNKKNIKELEKINNEINKIKIEQMELQNKNSNNTIEKLEKKQIELDKRKDLNIFLSDKTIKLNKYYKIKEDIQTQKEDTYLKNYLDSQIKKIQKELDEKNEQKKNLNTKINSFNTNRNTYIYKNPNTINNQIKIKLRNLIFTFFNIIKKTNYNQIEEIINIFLNELGINIEEYTIDYKNILKTKISNITYPSSYMLDQQNDNGKQYTSDIHNYNWFFINKDLIDQGHGINSILTNTNSIINNFELEENKKVVTPQVLTEEQKNLKEIQNILTKKKLQDIETDNANIKNEINRLISLSNTYVEDLTEVEINNLIDLGLDVKYLDTKKISDLDTKNKNIIKVFLTNKSRDLTQEQNNILKILEQEQKNILDTLTQEQKNILEQKKILEQKEILEQQEILLDLIKEELKEKKQKVSIFSLPLINNNIKLGNIYKYDITNNKISENIVSSSDINISNYNIAFNFTLNNDIINNNYIDQGERFMCTIEVNDSMVQEKYKIIFSEENEIIKIAEKMFNIKMTDKNSTQIIISKTIVDEMFDINQRQGGLGNTFTDNISLDTISKIVAYLGFRRFGNWFQISQIKYYYDNGLFILQTDNFWCAMTAIFVGCPIIYNDKLYNINVNPNRYLNNLKYINIKNNEIINIKDINKLPTKDYKKKDINGKTYNLPKGYLTVLINKYLKYKSKYLKQKEPIDINKINNIIKSKKIELYNNMNNINYDNIKQKYLKYKTKYLGIK